MKKPTPKFALKPIGTLTKIRPNTKTPLISQWLIHDYLMSNFFPTSVVGIVSTIVSLIENFKFEKEFRIIFLIS